MTSQIRVGIRKDMHNARFEFHSFQTNRLSRLSCIEYDDFLMSIKWLLVKKTIENLQKQKHHAKCPESLNNINLKQNTTEVNVP